MTHDAIHVRACSIVIDEEYIYKITLHIKNDVKFLINIVRIGFGIEYTWCDDGLQNISTRNKIPIHHRLQIWRQPLQFINTKFAE